LRFAAASQAHIAEGLPVDMKKAAGGAIFRCHIGDGGAVGERQVLETGAEELDKFSHHPVLAQHLGNSKHQVGRSDAFLHGATDAKTHYLGQQHGNRLAQHGRLGLDTAHSPAQHTQAVDHGGVRVGAHQGVGVGQHLAIAFGAKHPAGEKFQIDLVNNAGAGWHHLEIVKGLLAPFEELVALAVAADFQLRIALEGGLAAKKIHHHRVVDHQLGG